MCEFDVFLVIEAFEFSVESFAELEEKCVVSVQRLFKCINITSSNHKDNFAVSYHVHPITFLRGRKKKRKKKKT